MSNTDESGRLIENDARTEIDERTKNLRERGLLDVGEPPPGQPSVRTENTTRAEKNPVSRD